MTDGPSFYPEESLEAHGLTPDTWGSAGVYALALETPGLGTFRDRWYGVYKSEPPRGLIEAVDLKRALIYVGATGNLRDRLHDHVAGDVRRVKLLAVCPPVGVVDVWRYDSFDAAETHERRHAYELRGDGVSVWVNGELL